MNDPSSCSFPPFAHALTLPRSPPPLARSFFFSIHCAVEFKLNKVKADDELLTLIHRIMYGTPGKRTVIKKNIREFSGFVFDGADGDKEKAKKEDVISRAFTNTLNQMLDLFDLPRGSGAEGNKEARVARLVKFLEKPEASDNKNLKAGCVG